MDFLSNDFDHLTQDELQYAENFENNYNRFERNSVLFHTLQYLTHVKQQIDQLPSSGQVITTKNLKQIRPQDTSVTLSKLIAQHYQKIVDRKPQGQPLNDGDIFLLIYRTFRPQILTAVLLFHIDAVFRLAFSVFILKLFESEENNFKTMAYIYVAILSVFWYFSQLFKELATNTSNLLSIKIKSALSMLLYAKLSKLTSYVVNNSQHRYKLPNLLSNVLTLIEQRTATIIQVSVFPFMMIGITIILYMRIGWPCFIGLGIVLLVVPIVVIIAAKKTQHLSNVNQMKDKRIQITTQLIEGINCIKMNGWELNFQKLIKNARDGEVSSFNKLAFLRAVERGIGNSIGLIIAVVMFVMASTTSGLTTPTIFSVMEIRTTIKASVILMVMGIGLYYQTKVTLSRFALIFNIEERSMININEDYKLYDTDGKLEQSNHTESQFRMIPVEFTQATKGTRHKNRMFKLESIEGASFESLNKGSIKFENFNGFWKKQFDKPSLKGITFNFQSPRLYGITGKIGSGKSGLLSAVFGQIPYYTGQLTVTGSVAYVEQGAILFTDTIKNNILFGRQYNKTLYERAVKMSCLASDLDKMADKDLTIIGEKGVNLSGGQKIRLALARAVYSQADIYLFDHPLASVDIKVARKIFRRCIEPLSKQKMVILVTHRASLLKACDELLIMSEGRIIDHGPPESVGQKNNLWDHYVSTSHLFRDQDNEDNQNADPFLLITRLMSIVEESVYESTNDNEEPPDPHALLEQNENTTKVSSETYQKFFFAEKLNYFLLPLAFVLLVASEIIILAFLRILTDYKNVKLGNDNFFGGNFVKFWGTLGFLALLNLFFLILKQFLVNTCIVMSTTKIHQNMIHSFLRIPSSFYDQTSSGILINKFTTDLGILDNSMVIACIDSAVGPILVITAILNMVYQNAYFAIPVGILIVIVVAFYMYSRQAFLSCKQLDLSQKGPIFHFYNETIYGLTQIKLYNRRQAKIQQFSQIVNKSIKASIAIDQVSRGFGFYQSIAALFLMAAGMWIGIEVLPPYDIGDYGVSVLLLISICETLQFMLKQMMSVASYLVSAQRILQFQLFGQEKQLRTQYDKTIGLEKEVEAASKDEDIVSQLWPEKTTIKIENLRFKYKNNLPSIVNDLTFQIGEGQKIAIIGRSGAGKSSIIKALFRMVQPQLGCKYEIGGHNALEMGLHSLRQHISIIHQKPFLFTGTIKQNLDPSGVISEEVLWQALQDTNLKSIVEKLPNKLKTSISSKSQMFSMGEKQMLCIARLLLTKNKFLVLDEATSNLDTETDTFIQKLIREKFQNATVITVAHRLDTIVDYDRILVMEKGKIIEEGTPYELVKDRGIFYSMIRHSGRNESEIIIKSIKEKFKRRSSIL